MKVKLDPGAYMPERAHEQDAGLDLRSRETTWVPANGSAVFHTGVHIELPKGCAGVLVSKSGLNTNRGITSHGLIDEGYTGEIVVKLYNHSSEDYFIYEGDKISQLVIIPVCKPEMELVSFLDDTERGSNGFGSSGR